VKPGLCVR